MDHCYKWKLNGLTGNVISLLRKKSYLENMFLSCNESRFLGQENICRKFCQFTKRVNMEPFSKDTQFDIFRNYAD